MCVEHACIHRLSTYQMCGTSVRDPPSTAAAAHPQGMNTLAVAALSIESAAHSTLGLRTAVRQTNKPKPAKFDTQTCKLVHGLSFC